MILKKIISFLSVLISLNTFSSEISDKNKIIEKYQKMNLEKEIELKTFFRAINGYEKINDKKTNILTIIDYSKPSLEKRFYVMDLEKEKVLYSTYVMHGKNSGDNYTTEFSNILNSYKSSPGFYKTSNAYYGQFGYALRLNGLEEGINDNAFKRAIVLHGSKYAYPIPRTTMLSKSLGCPAIPIELVKPVINKIKDGSVLYIHTNQTEYLSNSKYSI